MQSKNYLHLNETRIANHNGLLIYLSINLMFRIFCKIHSKPSAASFTHVFVFSKD